MFVLHINTDSLVGEWDKTADFKRDKTTDFKTVQNRVRLAVNKIIIIT